MGLFTRSNEQAILDMERQTSVFIDPSNVLAFDQWVSDLELICRQHRILTKKRRHEVATSVAKLVSQRQNSRAKKLIRNLIPETSIRAYVKVTFVFLCSVAFSTGIGIIVFNLLTWKYTQ